MKNKIIKIFFSIILLLTIIFIYPKIRIYFTTNKLTTYDYDKRLRITYLMIDKDETKDKDITVANATKQNVNISLVNNGIAYLKKEGNYYVGYINDVNDYILEDVPDYSFTYNNLQGQVIDGCTFDLKKREVKIPIKYYENSVKEENVQMEIISRVDKKRFASLTSHLKISGLKNTKNDITLNGNETTSLISILNYNSKNSITKEEISIYVNNDKEKLDKTFYDWNSDAGTIEIKLSPVLVEDVVVTIDSNIISYNLLGRAAKADTESYASMDAAGKLTSAPKLSVGHKIALTSVPVAYKSDKVYGHPDMVDLYDKINSDNDLYNNCDTTNKTCEKYTSSLDYFAFDLSGTSDSKKVYSNPGDSISFGTHTYVKAYCSDHVDAADSRDDSTMEIRLVVIAISQEDNYVIFRIEPRDAKDNFYTQTPAGVIKLVWDDSYGKIIIKKKLVDQGTTVSIPKNTFGFTLYKDSECKTVKKTQKYINPDYGNTVSWTNLALGTYYVKESKCDSTKYRCDTGCKRVSVTKVDKKRTDSDGNILYLDTTLYDNPVTNYIKRFCVKAKKNDSEHSNDCAVQGIKFKLASSTSANPSYSDEQTTNSNGRVLFSNLKYQDYYLSETSADPTKATLYCNGEKKGDYSYWNENLSASTISASSLTEMNWNTTTKKYEGCPDAATTKAIVKSDHKKYYCVAVKKIDSITNSPLAGAQFTVNNNASAYPQYNSNGEKGSTVVKGNNTVGDGVAYFFLGTTSSAVKIKETVAPSGYALGSEITATPVAMPKGTTNNGTKGSSNFVETCRAAYNAIKTPAINYPDNKYVINWYKETEDGTIASGAKFKVRYTDSNNSIHYVVAGSAKADYIDASKVKKNCYVYKSLTTDASKATEFISDANGETCISGIADNGKKMYSVEEVESAKYHTFGKDKVKQISIGTLFISKDVTADSNTNKNKFVNYDTEFEFTKTVSSGDEENVKIIVNGKEKTLKDLTTEELKLLEFNVTDNNNKVVSFILENGVYEYAGNTIDKSTGTSTTALHLDNNRKIKIKHLPKGTYYIKEKNGKSCDSSSSYNDCIGYYYPNYTSDSSYKFTITECSSTNATSCTTHVSSKQTLENKPTEITFTKKDFYSYYDAADKNKSDSNVTFENDKERNDFDKIVFKIKDSNGKYLTLKKVRDVGDCSTDSSYSEYRYVKSDQTDTKGTELHTCGGHIKITNLCRGNEYTVEEVSVPDGSVYVKENTESTPTSVKYKIPCTEGDKTQSSTTNLISDKPTRVRFEKRDSKYNYLIQDETTTFEVYKCAKGTECHPSDYATKEEREKNGMTLVKFNPRAVITGDEEDSTDEEGLAGVEVYRKISDSDVSKGQKYETSLHPYNGILVLRYLESNYRYVLLETVAPKNYSLPSGRNAETGFTVTNITVKVDEVDVPNKPTSLIIRKYSDTGELLPGAEFKIYEGKTCDANLSAMNQPKTLLKLKTIRDGVYENRPTEDTDTILTCTDRDGEKCSEINTKLTYKDYTDSWANFDETLNTEKNKVEIKQGEALIQYLEYDHCYIIEEVKAPKGYSLPKNEEDRYTMVTIPKNTEYASDTYKTLINKPTPFTFYKYDEYNKLLDGAEFKLQKLDDNKKYHDIAVTREETETGVYYKADESSNNKIITTVNGSATVYYLEEGQYRIVEVTPAPGKELGKNPNIATFFVDNSGNVYGNSIIVNKSKTEKIEVKSSASAELVVSIQTGQKVIRYGLIIATIASVIIALMIMLRMYKKQSE